MSEYMERHSVSRLIGAPPGYVGYEEGGQLTEAVRRKPFSVVLFDEIEKAHHDVFNLLLQVLDEGRLTDSHGRTVDFRNAVLIMTSNIGSAEILEALQGSRIGFRGRSGTGEPESFAAVKERVLEKLRKHCTPEFINRVDSVVVFRGLSKDELTAIVDLQLERLIRRLEERSVALVLTPDAKRWLADAGYNPVYGARPLKRVIQSELESAIARKFIEDELSESCLLRVDARDGKLTFAREPLREPQPELTS
jgi:ATP-dependent Clp protease ATP-binding subunit ClpB